MTEGGETDFRFVPAISGQMLNVLKKGKEKLNGKPLNWWQENSLFKMDAGLISAYYLYEQNEDSLKNFRKQIQFPADSLFVLDSGGFEIFTNPELIKILKPEKVLKIQEAVADIGFILDISPYKLELQKNGTKKMIYEEKFFNYAMETTAKNTEIALSSRKSSHLKIYGVLQGMEYKHMINWYEHMKDFKPDGWALSPKPRNNYVKTAMFISLILEKEIKAPIHFLGVSGFNALGLIIYLLRKDEKGKPYFPHLITTDSTSYDSGARRRNYTLPGNFRKNIVIGREKDEIVSGKELKYHLGEPVVAKKKNPRTIPLKFLPCDCPICQNTTVEKMRSASNVGSIAVSLHNLYQQKILIRTLTSLIEDPEKYIEYVLDYNYNDEKVRKELSGFFKLIDGIVRYKRRYTKKEMSWETYFKGEDIDIDSENLFAPPE